MPTALSTTLSLMLLLRITTTSRPRRVERVAAIKAATVVVLIPPPVPPGLAPMNISTISNSRLDSVTVSSESGRVLKPAVRAVTDLNRAVSQRSDQGMPAKISPWFNHSVRASPPAPKTINSRVVRSTRRECRLSRRRLRRLRSSCVVRSLVTRHPSPPATISSITTAFTTPLLR